MPKTRVQDQVKDGQPGTNTYSVQIASRVEHGELDQDSGRVAQSVAQLRVQELTLAQLAESLQNSLSLINGDGSAGLLLNDKGAVGLDHLSATRAAKDNGTPALLESLLSLRVAGELDKGERHVVRVAANLDPALAILEKLTVNSSLESNVVLGLRQASDCQLNIVANRVW